MDTSLDMINSIMGNDKESFMTAFNAALATKVSDALEVKKVELASTLLTPPETEETNEVEPTEVETVGSDTSDVATDAEQAAAE
jgi:hypothetical protein